MLLHTCTSLMRLSWAPWLCLLVRIGGKQTFNVLYLVVRHHQMTVTWHLCHLCGEVRDWGEDRLRRGGEGVRGEGGGRWEGEERLVREGGGGRGRRGWEERDGADGRKK